MNAIYGIMNLIIRENLEQEYTELDQGYTTFDQGY